MEIYQKAFDIIERYFGTEEEDKDVSVPHNLDHNINLYDLQIAPVADANQFAFGAAGPGGDATQQPQQGFNF